MESCPKFIIQWYYGVIAHTIILLLCHVCKANKHSSDPSNNNSFIIFAKHFYSLKSTLKNTCRFRSLMIPKRQVLLFPFGKSSSVTGCFAQGTCLNDILKLRLLFENFMPCPLHWSLGVSFPSRSEKWFADYFQQPASAVVRRQACI